MEDNPKLIIYNAYLRASAEAKNRGFRKKKDPTFDMEKEAVLDKLERFFGQYRHIQPYIFFKASYETLGVDFIPLKEFGKHKAIKIYTDYVKRKYENSADSEDVINSFKDGIRFINDFTKKNNLKFLDYRDAVNEIGVPYYLIHLQEQNISFYHMHLFGISAGSIPSDYAELISQNFFNIFLETQQKYLTSIKMKEIGNALMGRIK